VSKPPINTGVLRASSPVVGTTPQISNCIFEQPVRWSRQTLTMTPSQMEMPIPVAVCAWCKPQELGTGVGAVSHGICPRHLRNLGLEMRGLPVKPPRRVTPKAFKSESLLF
jgi:hypothetical protein